MNVSGKTSNGNVKDGRSRYLTPGKQMELQQEWKNNRALTTTTFNILQIITKNKSTPNYIHIRLQNFYHKHRLTSENKI